MNEGGVDVLPHVPRDEWGVRSEFCVLCPVQAVDPECAVPLNSCQATISRRDIHCISILIPRRGDAAILVLGVCLVDLKPFGRRTVGWYPGSIRPTLADELVVVSLTIEASVDPKLDVITTGPVAKEVSVDEARATKPADPREFIWRQRSVAAATRRSRGTATPLPKREVAEREWLLGP